MDGSSLGHVAITSVVVSGGWDGPVCPARSYGPLLLSSRSSILVFSHLFSSRSEPCSLKIKNYGGEKTTRTWPVSWLQRQSH